MTSQWSCRVFPDESCRSRSLNLMWDGELDTTSVTSQVEQGINSQTPISPEQFWFFFQSKFQVGFCVLNSWKRLSASAYIMYYGVHGKFEIIERSNLLTWLLHHDLSLQLDTGSRKENIVSVYAIRKTWTPQNVNEIDINHVRVTWLGLDRRIESDAPLINLSEFIATGNMKHYTLCIQGMRLWW